MSLYSTHVTRSLIPGHPPSVLFLVYKVRRPCLYINIVDTTGTLLKLETAIGAPASGIQPSGWFEYANMLIVF
jgi:hypothetical protein